MIYIRRDVWFIMFPPELDTFDIMRIFILAIIIVVIVLR